MRSHQTLLILLLSSPCAGGDIPERTGETQILGVGDSLLAMHAPDADTMTVAAGQLDMSAELAAVGGETMLGDKPNSIPLQYEAGQHGDYELMITSGGGNNLVKVIGFAVVVLTLVTVMS